MPASVPFRIALFYAAVFLVIGVHVPFWPAWLKSYKKDEEGIRHDSVSAVD